VAVNGVAIAALAAGGIMVWSAVANAKITSSIQDIITGKSPPAGPGPDTLTSGQAADAASSVPGSVIPDAPANISGNEATGKLLAAGYGWGSGAEWNALYDLWQRESGWSNTAENPSSGAYGIAQALGHGPTNQYPAGAANPPPAGSSSASAQIAWGLSYIKSTYGDPVAAWNHEESEGWY
jgi:hypothetical protein